MESRATLKTYFETNDIPTQAQFWSWLDSYYHLEDGVIITNVDTIGDITTLTLSDASSVIIDNSTADTNAVHVNAAGEISIITEKVTPVAADMLLIEDSADGNNKKMVQLGNLPGSGGGETNTASNVGVGEGDVFKQKAGVNLELKTIQKGAGIDIENNTSEVVIKELAQDFTNLENYFGLVNQWRSGDVSTLLHLPEDIKAISENVMAVSHRGNVANGPAPITGDTNFGGIIIYDITDKSRPVVLSTFKDTNLVGSMDIKIVGNYLYNVSLRNPRLFIIDISDPSQPVKVSDLLLEATPTSDTACYKMDITDNGNYLVTCFRYDTTPTVSKILSVDISDKTAPVIASNVTHVGADWLYYIWTRKDFVFVTYYDGSTPANQLAVYDINSSTGALTFNREITQAGLSGVQAVHVQGKDLVINWQGDLIIFVPDAYTGDITHETTLSTNATTANRLAHLDKNDVNIFAIADYGQEKVQLICMNKDLTAILGTGVISNVPDFETVQTVEFIGNYLYVGNRMNSSAIQIYHFDYNAFSKNRNLDY